VLFLFNDFALDCERRELRAAGAPVPLEPQVFDLLVYLIENRDRVVSKDDLIASVCGAAASFRIPQWTVESMRYARP